MKKTKNNSKKRNSKIFLYLIMLFSLFLIGVLISQLDLDFKKEVQNFEIPDRCGPSPVGQEILHEFITEEECKVKCSNLCEVRDLKYVSHNFLSENRTCYVCDCNCK